MKCGTAQKRVYLTDRKGGSHKGWIEVTVNWAPDAYVGEKVTEPPASPGKRRRIVAQPMAGTLHVEVLRGRDLGLCEDEQHTSAAADPVLFTGALVTLVFYLLLGGVFYVLNEEHCEEQPASGMPLVSYAAADADGDNLLTTEELAGWVTPPPPVCTPWTIVDAGYFTVVTFTTIGYGDFGPSNPTSKVFTAFFALLGVTVRPLSASFRRFSASFRLIFGEM